MEPSDRNLFQSVIKMVDSLSATGNYDTIVNILSLLCLLSVLNRSPNAAALSGGGSPFSSLLGELMKGTNTNTANNIGNPVNANPLAGMLGELLKGGNNTGNAASPLVGLLGELMKGGGNGNNTTAAATNPLGNMLGELLKGSGSSDNHSGNPLALVGMLSELLKGSGNSNNNASSSPLGGLLGSALSSPDLLMSLLPLLGGLQNKAKNNNTPNIASVMGILNNLSGLGANNGASTTHTPSPTANKNTATKSSTSDLKSAETQPAEKKTLNEAPPEVPPSPSPPENSLPAPIIPEVIPFKKEETAEPAEVKSASRFLKWKTNF